MGDIRNITDKPKRETKPRKPMGRRPKPIDQEQFEKLCEYQCTKQEICGVLKVSDKTLDRWCAETYDETFSEVFKEKRQAGRVSLRRAQFEQAKKSSAMAIWLGKQYLEQRDEVVAVVREDVDFSKLTEDQVVALARRAKRLEAEEAREGNDGVE